MARLPNTAERAHRSVPRGLRRLAGPVLLVALWVVLAQTGVISAKVLAPPSAVGSAALDLIRTGELQVHLVASLQRVVLGLLIGVTLGTVLAVLAGLFRLGEDLIDGPMQILRALPALALVPLFIIWFGIKEEPKIYLIALAVTFPIYLNTYAGIRSVDARLVEAAGTFGLSRRGLVRHVILPGALPSFFTGLRFALAIAWLVLVIGEQINAKTGVGYLMMNARESLRTDIIVVGLIIYGVFGFLSDLLVRWLERSTLPWQSTFTGT
jgi:sulfonate transport system permease protein